VLKLPVSDVEESRSTFCNATSRQRSVSIAGATHQFGDVVRRQVPNAGERDVFEKPGYCGAANSLGRREGKEVSNEVTRRRRRR
jgi:hypothetical protein